MGIASLEALGEMEEVEGIEEIDVMGEIENIESVGMWSEEL